MKIKNKNKKKWNLGLSERKEREKEREREKKKVEREWVYARAQKTFFLLFLLFSSSSSFLPVTLKTKWRERPALWQILFALFFFFFFFTIHFVKQKLFKQKSFFLSSLEGEKRFRFFFEKVFLCWKEFKVLCDQKEKTKAVLFGLKSYSKALSRKQSSLKKQQLLSSYLKKKGRERFSSLFFFSFSLWVLCVVVCVFFSHFTMRRDTHNNNTPLQRKRNTKKESGDWETLLLFIFFFFFWVCVGGLCFFLDCVVFCIFSVQLFSSLTKLQYIRLQSTITQYKFSIKLSFFKINFPILKQKKKKKKTYLIT